MFFKLLRFSLRIIATTTLVSCIAILAIVYHYSRDLPSYEQLKNYYPPSITRLYSADGKLIEEYAREHRIFVPIAAIPNNLQNAFIAAEDKRFYEHKGIDIIGLARAITANVVNLLKGYRMAGGSTITQQVVKNFLLTSERSIERKIKEAILAYRISQVLTKEQVLELYLNQIYLGRGSYGVAAAALAYFNKSIEELTLNESAVLAAMPKAPARYDPKYNYQNIFNRKNYVLQRMQEDGYITNDQAQSTKLEPIKLAQFSKVKHIKAPYYAAKVREEIISMFGEEYFYTAGLTVITCLDSAAQQAANKALRKGIENYDKTLGWRSRLSHIDIDQDWQSELKNIAKTIYKYKFQLAVVLTVTEQEAEIGLIDGSKSKVLLKDSKWATQGAKTLEKILATGDVIYVSSAKDKHILQQAPLVNGALMAVENATGKVLAAVGGYDFALSKFDRTYQASRQPGSLIKPFVYLAALKNGAKPNDIFHDAPLELSQGPGLPMWKPKNYENNFLGPMTLRRGLEKSRNLVTIRAGLYAGLDSITELIKQFDINENPPKLYSLMLGSLETTLAKMVLAYSAIARGGYKVEPHFIELIKDRKGNVIYQRDYAHCQECRNYQTDSAGKIIIPNVDLPATEQLLDSATSYQLTSLLMGVVQRGSGRRAKQLDSILAGKTGTTNDAKDAWFVGFSPKITVGTYVGYDEPKSLGARASGATIALPLFVNFMNNYQQPTIDFLVPENVTLAAINHQTGLPATAVEEGTIIEAFKLDSKPQSIDELQQLIQPNIFEDDAN